MIRIILAYLGFAEGPDEWSETERFLKPVVHVGIPLATALMFGTVLVVQEAWVEELARPIWVDAATGVAVIGWLAGFVLVLVGFPHARFIPPLASVSGLLAQWGDTLGGEVGFDFGFYRTQGIAIGLHLIATSVLALMPLSEERLPPQDKVRI